MRQRIKAVLKGSLKEIILSQVEIIVAWIIIYTTNYILQIVKLPLLSLLYRSEKFDFFILLLLNIALLCILTIVLSFDKIKRNYIITTIIIFTLIIIQLLLFKFYIPNHLFEYENTLFYISNDIKPDVFQVPCDTKNTKQLYDCLIKYNDGQNDLIWYVDKIKLRISLLFISFSFSLTSFSFFIWKFLHIKLKHRK